MTRAIRFWLSTLTLASIILLAGGFSFAFANSNYNYHHDSSYNNSFNAYDSYNYGNYSYDYRYPYSYGNDYYNRNTSYYSNYYAQPACSIVVSRYGGTYGYDRTVSLSWTSSNATSAYLTNVGSVGTNGAQAIYYPFNSSYTLTVYGPGGSSSCTTYTQQYSYNNNYVYPNTYSYPTYTYPTYTYPSYTYVPLSQIPYTGFDFGTFGNSLYWFGIVLVAFVGAYLIVYGHSRLMPRAFAREVAHAARNQIRVVRSILR